MCGCASAGSALDLTIAPVFGKQQHPQLAFLPESLCASPPSVHLLPPDRQKQKEANAGKRTGKACQRMSSSALELSHLRYRCRRCRDGLPLISSWFLCFFNPSLLHTPSPSSSSLSSSIGQHQHPGTALSRPHLSRPHLSFSASLSPPPVFF